MGEAMGKLMAENSKNGTLVDGGEFSGAQGHGVLRLESGKVSELSDGPFAEAKEAVGGYAILEYPTHEAAVKGSHEFLGLHAKKLAGLGRPPDHASTQAAASLVAANARASFYKIGYERRPSMNRDRSFNILLSLLMIFVALVAARPALAQAAAAKDPYPTMAPLEQYLMDRDAEIALARSAAPDSISHDASVAVLTRHGYETAVTGKNGWVCVVGRSWGAMFDHPEFWNPKVRAPGCYNAQAARSVLPYEYKRAELMLSGKSKAEAIAALKSAIGKKELPTLEPGSVCYMMSKGALPHRSGRPQHAACDVLRSVRGRRILRRQSCGLSDDRRELLVFFARHFSGTQILPSISVLLIGADKWSDGSAPPAM